jgi:hypothetical protein
LAPRGCCVSCNRTVRHAARREGDDTTHVVYIICTYIIYNDALCCAVLHLAQNRHSADAFAVCASVMYQNTWRACSAGPWLRQPGCGKKSCPAARLPRPSRLFSSHSNGRNTRRGSVRRRPLRTDLAPPALQRPPLPAHVRPPRSEKGVRLAQATRHGCVFGGDTARSGCKGETIIYCNLEP